MIYVAVLVVLGSPITMLALTTSRAAAEGDMLSEDPGAQPLLPGQDGLRVPRIDRRTATVTGLGKILQFTGTAGFDGANIVTGHVIRYEIQAGGIGQMGNLVRIDATTGQQVVLTNTINVARSSFTMTGSGVTIALTTTGATRNSAVATMRRGPSPSTPQLGTREAP